MQPDQNRYRRPSRTLIMWQATERVVAALGLLLLLPLLCLVWLFVRLDSRGPALYRQQRLGLAERVFTLLKFRSMRQGTDEGVPQHLRQVVESGRDERVTRTGRLLRATSLDELPQLWNVVRGEMALVGPRPLLPEQRPAMPSWAAIRFAVRPGITGLAQVTGRRSINWREQMAWDCAFVRKDSVRLRIWLIWRTFFVLFRRRGLYGSPADNWRAYLPR